MNEKIAQARNFVAKHKVALTAAASVAVTTTVALALSKASNAHRDEFLAKHNLLDEFYATFESDEI